MDVWIKRNNFQRVFLFFFQKQEGRKSGTKRLTYQEHRFHRCSAKITSKNNINPWGDALFIRGDAQPVALSPRHLAYLYVETSLATWRRNRRKGKKEKEKKGKRKKGGTCVRLGKDCSSRNGVSQRFLTRSRPPLTDRIRGRDSFAPVRGERGRIRYS